MKIKRLLPTLMRCASNIARVLGSPVLVGLAMIIGGAAAAVTGVHVLYGAGWALLAGGALSVAAGILLLKGAANAG